MTTDTANSETPVATRPNPPAGRPLRQDALRNRARILEAASRLFADAGFEATMDHIAQAAGVGIGTVYRRFPTKQDLIDALLQDRLDRVLELGQRAGRCEDPWEGLVLFIEGLSQLQIIDRSLAELLHTASGMSQRLVEVRKQLTPLVEGLVHRAIEAGQLRADVEGSDIALLQMMVCAVADYTRQVTPDAWHRFLNLLLDALEPRRCGTRPLREPPLTMDQLDAALHANKGLAH